MDPNRLFSRNNRYSVVASAVIGAYAFMKTMQESADSGMAMSNSIILTFETYTMLTCMWQAWYHDELPAPDPTYNYWDTLAAHLD